MNTYYKAAKLTTGELLAFTTEQEITSRQLNELRYIDIQNPVAFYSFRFLEDGKLNEVVGMQPWVPITHDEHYPLAVQSIVTIADLDARAIASYEQYISGDGDPEQIEMDYAEGEDIEEELLMIGEFDTKILH
jgi:hypothetical protein